jgi:tellurite methyltransferase
MRDICLEEETTVKGKNPYDERYASKEYYWGKKPSLICDKVIEIIKPSAKFCPKLLDLGCGEGRNAVYFAKHGFNVVGLDSSAIGLKKTKRYAEDEGVQVKMIHGNINDYQLTETFDVIFSTGTLHFLSPKDRRRQFQHYKAHTSPKGINVISVFVRKPFIPRAPDFDKGTSPFRSGELMSYYWDWEIMYCAEEIFNCMSSGVAHKHVVDRIIARRYQEDK